MVIQATHCVGMRSGVKFGDAVLVDTMLKDGLTDSFNNYHMGITGNLLLAVLCLVECREIVFQSHSQSY